MRLCGLRLLVALLTFGAGVAISSLWNSPRAPRPCPKYGLEYTSRSEVAPPPSPELPSGESLGKAETPLEQCKLGQSLPTPVVAFSHEPDTSRAVFPNGILQNKVISKPVPRYPPAAKAARVGGVVRVQIVVDESGDVISARAVDGDELLRDAAVNAACRSRFSPTLFSGTPVKVAGVITYNFVLQ